jgi:hypothetical protein
MAEVDCGANQSSPKMTAIAATVDRNTDRLFSERPASLYLMAMAQHSR